MQLGGGRGQASSTDTDADVDAGLDGMDDYLTVSGLGAAEDDSTL